MITRYGYKQKLFLYFFGVFLVFTVIIGAFQYKREKDYKISSLEKTLDTYTGLVQNYLTDNNIYGSKNYKQLDSLVHLFQEKHIRVTIIDFDGIVLYDSFVDEYQNMENHKSRPEIQKALYSDSGSNIRLSASTGKKFYYYAKMYNDYFVRTAMLYDIQGRELLTPNKLFLLVILILFFIIWASLAYVADKFGKSVSSLRDFAIQASKTGEINSNIEFPKNEIGVIGNQIVEIFNKLQGAKNDIQTEKEKLISHIQIAQEGIAFFTSKKKKIMANNHFIQYINTISDKLTVSLDNIFSIEELSPINEFLEANRENAGLPHTGELPGIKFEINRGGKFFNIRCILFQDNSFEISITDITKLEKRKILKQEMTNNIALELQTPLNAMKVLLENVIKNPNLSSKEQIAYAEKAMKQLKRMTKLTYDTGVLNKIEEVGSLYTVKNVNIHKIVKGVVENQHMYLAEKQIKVDIDIAEDIVIKGNDSLVASIFQNLLENSIQYAGKKIHVSIKMYLEDKYNYYFSFSDTGSGIAEEYLPRIFERFYRAGKEKSEEYEGSGLGLAIVKNAVLFHKGEISAKNRKEGGIEFIFSLSKK
ncbi:MAG: two-component sensor histidine kinase [Bacteroidales bacterium]|nr:two-component sensor histidine kinase [Bacteroidales bacterium]